MKEFVISTFNNTVPAQFAVIVDGIPAISRRHIVSQLFSGEYIGILDYFIKPNNVNEVLEVFPHNTVEIPFEKTLLAWAIMEEQVDLVEFLLSKGAFISIAMVRLATTLHRNIDITNTILENVNSEVLHELNDEDMKFFVNNENLDILRMLFYRGVNFNTNVVYHVMASNDTIANFMLDAGVNVRGQTFIIGTRGVSKKTRLRLDKQGANVIHITPIKLPLESF